MKRNRLLWPVLVLIVAALLFAASCGEKPEQGTKPSNPSGSAADLVNPYAETEGEAGTTFNVVFNRNYEGAGVSAPVKVEKGSSIAENQAPVPEREGEYSFSGWYKDRACTEKYDFSAAVNANLVLFAGWRSDTVTVSFNYNYIGGPDILRVRVGNGEKAASAEAPERAHYAFLGWYEDPESGTPFSFDTPVTGNLTLYALWEAVEAVVTFDTGAEDAGEIESITVEVGKAVPKPEDPVRKAYDFEGWYLQDGTAFDFEKEVTTEDAASGTIALTASWKVKVLTVTFDWGEYTDGTPSSAEVEYGKTVTEPENGRSGYTLVWQLAGSDYGFSTPVEDSITLTAAWTRQGADDGSLLVTFLYNYEGAPSGGTYMGVSVQPRRRVSVPEKPSREGYYFAGWYSDAACTTKFNFDQYVRNDLTAYAKWLTRYTFESEYVDFTGLQGAGYSNEVRELQLIKKDVTGTCQASNGYYVTSMFIKGAHLVFNIQSDGETDNAVIILRIQAEYVDMTMNPESYVVSVNGVPVDYQELTISNPAHGNDITTNERRPFFDYELTGKFHLEEGNNVVQVLTNNTVDFDAMGMHFGTLSSYAPMLDCIYVCSDTELTWEPKVSNIAAWEASQDN